MSVLFVTGTGTSVGKTIVTAAIAALAVDAGQRVAVVKPVQTGVRPDEPGDVEVVARLSGAVDVHELARYPEPLAPATAARRAGLPDVPWLQISQTIKRLADARDLVLVEGAGGVLVHLDRTGGTIADVAASLGANVLVVTSPGLGALNGCALTTAALAARGITCAGLVIGSWPSRPDLASRCNVADFESYARAPLVGAVPEHAAGFERDAFHALARDSLAPQLGGTWDVEAFRMSAHAADD